jgi:uroporphyrinogen decarboxylase
MGIDFDISEDGKIQIDPIQTKEDLDQRMRRVSKQDYEKTCYFVGSVLTQLKHKLAETSPETTLIGFVGLPFTLASYIVEGETGTSTGFPHIHKLMKDEPELLTLLLSLLVENIVNYACYQIDSGAQVLQVFDSWAGHVDDNNYAKFCQPFQQKVIRGIKEHYADVPIIIYMAPGPYSTGGRRLEALAETGADIVSVDHTVDIALAKAILPDNVGLQGNLDPSILREGPLSRIRSRTLEILDAMKGRRRCILNLGHGILSDTPEAYADCFIRTVQSYTPNGESRLLFPE